MQEYKGAVKVIFLAVAVSFFLPLSAHAITLEKPAGEVISLEGKALLKRQGKKYRLKVGVKVKRGDVIVTGRRAKVTILLRDGSTVTIRERTRLMIKEMKREKRRLQALFALFVGKVRFAVSSLYRKLKGSYFQVETPTAVTGVRGTEFAVFVDTQGVTQVFTLSGEVFVRGAGGEEVMLVGGRFTVVDVQGRIGSVQQIPEGQVRRLEQEFDPDVREEEAEEEVREESEEIVPRPGEEEVPAVPEVGPEEFYPETGRLDPEELKGKVRFRFR